jgi:hypothetical protein
MDGHFSHERKSGDSREVAAFTTRVAKDTKSFVGAAVTAAIFLQITNNE